MRATLRGIRLHSRGIRRRSHRQKRQKPRVRRPPRWHYAPPPSCIRRVMEKLKLMGVTDLADVELELVQPPAMLVQPPITVHAPQSEPEEGGDGGW